MGMKTVIPGRNSFQNRETAHSLSGSSIHRARVTEVHVDRGTVSLSFEDITLVMEATMPLMGLSAPLEGTSANYANSSWGRYIPQVGDVLLVGFGANRKVHVLGYSSIYYQGFRIEDENSENVGGIGWGTVSGKDVKPGDWDFKSSRNSFLYLGDRAVIGSTSCKSTYNQSTNDIVNTAFLIINEASSSDIRYGAVRRRVLPTDTQETYMPSIRGGTPCQEFTVSTKWDAGLGPVDLAFYSQGDVVETTGGTSTVKISTGGQPVRKWSYFMDATGLVKSYDETIDSMGNINVTAPTAVTVNYSTPLATWNITNSVTNISSSGSISNTAPSVNITASSTANLISPMVNLGNVAGALPLIKNTPTLTASWTSYFVAASAAWSALAANPTVSPDPATTAIFTTAATTATSMAAALSSSTTLQVRGL